MYAVALGSLSEKVQGIVLGGIGLGVDIIGTAAAHVFRHQGNGFIYAVAGEGVLRGELLKGGSGAVGKGEVVCIDELPV